MPEPRSLMRDSRDDRQRRYPSGSDRRFGAADPDFPEFRMPGQAVSERRSTGSRRDYADRPRDRAAGRERLSYYDLEMPGRSGDRHRSPREEQERERARRRRDRSDYAGRNAGRELIDGRGSIDSRAFNEQSTLVSYTIDKRDTHDPHVEAPGGAAGRWHSHSGSEPHRTRKAPASTKRPRTLDGISDAISGSRQYSSRKSGGFIGALAALPLAAKLLILLIAVLLVVLLVIVIL